MGGRVYDMTASRSLHEDLSMRFCVIALAATVAVSWAAAPVCADSITDDNVIEAVSAATTPADHQALAAYFSAKAEAAIAQSDRHTRMAAAFGGKGHVSRLHCDALVRTAKRQAEDYAALAKEQKKLAEGK